MRARALATRRDDRGLVEWALLIAVTVLAIGFIVAGVVITNVARGSSAVDTTLKEQRADAAISDAVARLSDGEPVGATRASAQVACSPVSNRSVCYQYWALPVPGNVVDPLVYDLVVQTWVDTDHDGAPPENASSIRAVRVRLSAVTYQTDAAVAPTVAGGQVRYIASPPGPLSEGLFGFTSVTLAGPDVVISSYNSTVDGTSVLTGDGTVASGGQVAYGAGVKVDGTVLYGTPGTTTGTTSRCTGEPCSNSELVVRDEVYLPNPDAAVAWMSTVPCTTTVTGDWVASQNAGRIPSGTLCVGGALIIDVPTSLSGPGTKVVVQGAVDISAPLNAPAPTAVPNPSRLFVYSAGQGVALRPEAYAAGPLVLNAVVYAPLAACTADPASTAASVSEPGTTLVYGSIACDTVSLGGSFTMLQDDASLVTQTDPVPGARKAWTIGSDELVQAAAGSQTGPWDSPDGWAAGTCAMPGPVNAMAYWRLLEPSGALAADAAGGAHPLGWRTSTSGRGDGICGRSAILDDTSQPQVSGTATLVSATNGVTLEWWGKTVTGTPVKAAGVQVEIDADHVNVLSGAGTTRFPFTVQNADQWHLFTVTVSNDGDARLYVDGQLKEPGAVASPKDGSDTAIAKGSAGSVSDVVAYARVLSAADVATRWATWNDNVVFTPSDAGTPFTAPGDLTDDGTIPSNLKAKWTPAAGTLPPSGSGSADYLIERSTSQAGTYSAFATVPIGTTSYSKASPEAGSFWYRVCTVYNGDRKCSTPANIVTVPPPTVPVVTVSDITTTTAKFTWTNQLYVTRFESQVAINDGPWQCGSTCFTSGDGTQVLNEGTALYRVHGPTTTGTKLAVRVRAINPAGVSAWSTTVVGALKEATPTVSVSSYGAGDATFVWNDVPNRVHFEAQYRLNDGAWSGVYGNAGTSWYLGPTTQGTKFGVRVRAMSKWGGPASDWSNEATVVSRVDANPAWNAWTTTESYPTFTHWVGRVDGQPLCPAGTSVYTIFRDGISNWGYWNGFTAAQSNGGSSQTVHYVSNVASYDLTVQMEIQGYCRNDATGARSGGISTGIYTTKHAIGAPWGVSGGVPSYRTASWSAGCAADLYPVYNVQIGAAWGTWVSGDTTATSFSKGDAAWGSFYISVWAKCRSGGGQDGPSAGWYGSF